MTGSAARYAGPARRPDGRAESAAMVDAAAEGQRRTLVEGGRGAQTAIGAWRARREAPTDAITTSAIPISSRPLRF
jgi:hypothetical protein